MTMDWGPQRLKQVAEGSFGFLVWVPECPSGLVLSLSHCPLAPASWEEQAGASASPSHHSPPTPGQENHLQCETWRGVGKPSAGGRRGGADGREGQARCWEPARETAC